ncbi:class I SAM-dependent methyltransferase [Halothiobacillus sp. DCM-1]|uniref:class I SAM-dependent methyltransferase n=1 Tax=Halothiobacillus sp. DCM-1 TaxID=3112558 RepID=UPI003249BC4B
MSLKHTYTLWAPLYDALLRPATEQARARNLAELGSLDNQRLALIGIGSGLDLDWLAQHSRPAHAIGIDLTPAMLHRAARRQHACPFPLDLIQGDAMTLPLASASCDTVLLHLILAVVPQPERVLAEASRILKPGGRLLIFDKFLRPGQTAPVRRALSPLLGALATRTNVEFEPLLAAHPELCCQRDEPLLARGWFRGITLQKSID